MSRPPSIGLRTFLRRRWRIAHQLASVLVMIVLANCAVIFLAMSAWTQMEEKRFKDALSPQTLMVIEAVEAGKAPPVEGLEAVIAETDALGEEINARGNAAILICLLMTALGDFVLGTFLLSKLGKGLNDVAGTARRVAVGDLSARASRMKWASTEEAQLVEDFNGMAQALQRAERELAESTAAIAHELRTPLTILRGRLQGITDGVFCGDDKEIRALLFQVEGLGRLVEDLQTINMGRSDRLVLNLSRIDLAVEAERVVDAMRPDLQAAGVTINLDLRPTIVTGDDARIRQLIGAVLSNVERYAAGGGPVTISTRRTDSGAILDVLDGGPGLLETDLEQAFDRFWRGEGSRGRGTGGSGLGLAVVRAIAEAHGGEVSLRNRSGGGALFRLELSTRPWTPAADLED